MAPKVLVSDKLSPTAVQIFRDRGIDVDFEPDLGKDKEKLFEVIGQYDHHGRTCHCHDVCSGAANSGGQRFNPRWQMGKIKIHGRGADRQNARRQWRG